MLCLSSQGISAKLTNIFWMNGFYAKKYTKIRGIGEFKRVVLEESEVFVYLLCPLNVRKKGNLRAISNDKKINISMQKYKDKSNFQRA